MKNQPVLDLPKTATETWLDVAAWLFVAMGLALTIGYYSDLPEQIPTHFGPSGEADKFGSKYTIFFIPVLSLVLVAGFVYLLQFPHKFNYLNKITPENAESEYRRMRVGLRVVNVLTSLLMLVITWNFLRAATSEEKGLSVLFWIVFMLTVLVPPIILFGGQGKKSRT